MLDQPPTCATPDEAIHADYTERRQPPAALMQCVLQALDQQADGLAVVDEEARIIYANPIAQRTFGEFGWLREDGVLASPQTAERETWAKALRAACRQHTRSMVELSADTGSVFAAVAPMVVGSRMLALISLGRTEVGGTLELYMFAKRYNLSSAEREVLQKFCKGHKPNAIAQLQGVAVCTVVTQLAAIRAKSGCADLRDLLHKIARLPALRPLVMDNGIH